MPVPVFARLHAIFASDKPVAVVFRRGPAKQVATFLWNRKTDTFTIGQWFKGLIYANRCDLSPDGRYMIYFAYNGKVNQDTRRSWTAVSFAPYLKAINLYQKGDTWQGGGLFLSNKTFWLNDDYFSEKRIIRESSGLEKSLFYDKTHDPSVLPCPKIGFDYKSTYYYRLLRDGWTYYDTLFFEKENQVLFRKSVSKGWILQKHIHEDDLKIRSKKTKQIHWEHHSLFHKTSKTEINCPNWEWAEQDNCDLVWAEKGCLYRCQLTKNLDLSSAKLLYDFNTETFQALKAPY